VRMSSGWISTLDSLVKRSPSKSRFSTSTNLVKWYCVHRPFEGQNIQQNQRVAGHPQTALSATSESKELKRGKSASALEF
jgi:hypothetical protein